MLISLALVVFALALAVGYHRRRGGLVQTLLLVGVLVFGSVLFFACLGVVQSGELWKASRPLLAFAFTLVTLALLYSPEPSLAEGGDRLYESRAHNRYLALFPLIGATIFSPICLVLAAPVLAAVPKPERKGKAWVAACVAVAGLVVMVLLPVFSSADLSTNAVTHRVDPGLLGWNLVYLAAGANLGLIVWFLGSLLMLASYRAGEGRGWLLTAVIVGAFALPLISAHDFAGVSASGLGLAFLPLYGALWFVPVRVPSTVAILLTAVAMGLFLWPAWLAPLETAAGDDRPSLHARSLASRLPYETTQEHAPATTEWQGTGVLSRSLGPGLEDGEQGPALAPASGPAWLMIASERPLEAVLLDFGSRAKSDLVVNGGAVNNTVFKPDGGVRFEITVAGADRTHPMWYSDKRHSIYLLEVEMLEGPERPLPVAIMARPADALPRALDPTSLGGEAAEE